MTAMPTPPQFRSKQEFRMPTVVISNDRSSCPPARGQRPSTTGTRGSGILHIRIPGPGGTEFEKALPALVAAGLCLRLWTNDR
jgi:hypothetical protein